jgi:hypothetical protein
VAAAWHRQKYHEIPPDHAQPFFHHILPPKPVLPHFFLEDKAGNSISSFSRPECTFSPIRTTQQSANISIKLNFSLQEPQTIFLFYFFAFSSCLTICTSNEQTCKPTIIMHAGRTQSRAETVTDSA